MASAMREQSTPPRDPYDTLRRPSTLEGPMHPYMNVPTRLTEKMMGLKIPIVKPVYESLHWAVRGIRDEEVQYNSLSGSEDIHLHAVLPVSISQVKGLREK